MIHFNGVDLSEYINITDIKREIMPEQIVELGSVSGVIGNYVGDVGLGSRKVEVEYFFNEKTKAGVRARTRELAQVLHTTEAVPMWFEDEPNMKYMAIFSGTSSVEELFTFGKGTLSFIIPEGVALGMSYEKTLEIGTVYSSFSRDSQGFDGDGNIVEANFPRFSNSKDGKGMWVEGAVSNAVPSPLTLEGFEFEVRNIGIQNTKILDGVAYLDFVKKSGKTGDIRFHFPPMQVSQTESQYLSFDLKIEEGTITLLVEGSSTDNFSSGKQVGEILSDGTFVGGYGTRLHHKEHLGDDWYRYHIFLPDSFFGGSGTECLLEFQHGWSYVGNVKYQFRRPMLYKGNTIRNFVPFDMADEVYTLEVGSLQGGGCFEHQFLVEGKAIPSVDTSHRSYLWTINGSDGDYLAGCFLFKNNIYIENASEDTVFFPIVEGWHTFGLRFMDDKLAVVFDGTEGSHSITILTNKLKDFVVSKTNEWGLCSAIHDTIRISDLTKTITDLVNTGNGVLESEESTLELFKFNGNLDSEMANSDSDIEFSVNGTLPTYPIITVKLGNAVDVLTIIHNGTESLKIKYPFKSGTTVVVDCGVNNITIDGESGLKYLSLDSSFIEFKPTTHRVSINSGTSASMKVSYTERWL